MSELELSLHVEYHELFSFQDRVRAIADRIRGQLDLVGIGQHLETEVFDEDLEMHGPEGSRLAVRMDSYHLEITGAPPEAHIHLLAALVLEQADVFRLASVEIGFGTVLPAGNNQLTMVRTAFQPMSPEEEGPQLDRRFAMTWEWSDPTSWYSFLANDTEDRELFLSFKARQGYMTVPELKGGRWIDEQGRRFDTLVTRFLSQLGWKLR